MSKLLLRNIGSEIMNPLLLFVMDDLGMAIPEKTDFTPEVSERFAADAVILGVELNFAFHYENAIKWAKNIL